MFTTPSVAVVTGAAKGIGFTIAQTLLESGSSVLVFDLDADAAKAAVDRLSADHGDRVGISVGSVTSSDDLNAAFDTAEAELGPVDVLVNNAGFTGIVPIIDMEEKDWTAVMSVLTTGPFLGTQILARRVIARGGTACVVNTSSVNYRSATEGMAHYCSGKAAVSMFTQVAAAELGRHGIRVNAVAPGLTRTELTESASMTTGVFGDALVERTPLGRVGETSDIAKVVRFLASDDSAWITGETISVDGGLHVKGVHSYWDTFQAAMAAQNQ
jgi:NAD(P)-dependent dehydrogenase (short-subunit alcohol dehydrogenase family)